MKYLKENLNITLDMIPTSNNINMLYESLWIKKFFNFSEINQKIINNKKL